MTKLDEIIENDIYSKKILQILLSSFILEKTMEDLSIELNTTRPTLKTRINKLLEAKLILKIKTNIFLTTNIDTINDLYKKLPIDQNAEDKNIQRLKRKLVHTYIQKINIEEIKNIKKERKDEIEIKVNNLKKEKKKDYEKKIKEYNDEKNNLEAFALYKYFQKRPEGYIDIKAIVHPTLSVANDLKLKDSGISSVFKKTIGNKILNSDDNLLHFLNNKNIQIYNFYNDTILDNDKNKETTEVFDTIYSNLLIDGKAKQDICINIENKLHFYTLYIVIQSNYLGIQSILVDQTQKVKQNRNNLRLINRHHHFMSSVKDITKDLELLNIDHTEEYDFLLKKLKTLSSYDYYNTIYTGNHKQTDILPFRGFNLNKNMISIIEQLNYLYGNETELLFKNSDKDYKLNKVYDIPFYEALYILLGKLKNQKDPYKYILSIYGEENVLHIKIEYDNISSSIEDLIINLQKQIKHRAGSSLPHNLLDLSFYLDEVDKNYLLETMVYYYFQNIALSKGSNEIIFKFNTQGTYNEV